MWWFIVLYSNLCWSKRPQHYLAIRIWIFWSAFIEWWIDDLFAVGAMLARSIICTGLSPFFLEMYKKMITFLDEATSFKGKSRFLSRKVLFFSCDFQNSNFLSIIASSLFLYITFAVFAPQPRQCQKYWKGLLDLFKITKGFCLNLWRVIWSLTLDHFLIR